MSLMQNLINTIQNPPRMFPNTKLQPPNTLGVNAKGPMTPVPQNMTLASNQINNTPKPQSNVNNNTLLLQKALNKQNAGLTGWVPLKEDGIMGPKTQAATTWKPQGTVQQPPQIPQTPQQPPQQPVQPTQPQTSEIDKAIENYQKTNNQQPQLDTSRQGLLQTATGMGTTTPSMIQQLQNILTEKKGNIKALQDEMAQKIAEAQNAGGDLNFVTGKVARIQDLYNSRIQNASNEMSSIAEQLSSANQTFGTQSGLIQDALGQQQYQQLPYGTQFGTPEQLAQGQGFGQMSGTGGNFAQNTIQDIAEKVRNGTMGYSAGLSLLQRDFGALGSQQLNQILGPNFNAQESDARARAQETAIEQTGTMGGQVTKAADNANQTLNTLEQAFAKLNKLQTGGIPATNNIANWIARQLGQGALSEYESMLADARSQLASVLSVTGTPSGAESTAFQMLPSNMTPTQFETKVKAARELIRQKVEATTKIPQTTPLASTGGGSNPFSPENFFS